MARRVVEKDEMCKGRQTAKYRSTVNALKDQHCLVISIDFSLPDG